MTIPLFVLGLLISAAICMLIGFPPYMGEK